MTVDLRGLPIFYETLEPEFPTSFDYEMDSWVKSLAQERGFLKGFCNVSGTETEFRVLSDNLREDLVSLDSGSINRHRQAVCALSLATFAHPYAVLNEIAAHINTHNLKVFLAETHSPLFRFLSEYLKPELFISSEYFGESHQSGVVVGGVLHQDLQRTSFSDETFDIILTFEVFEHIPDALKAEREVVRILKPGGIYCFTVPFLPQSEHDVVLAELDETGALKHLAEPQYHGDPLRPEEGILVYRLFSYHDLRQRFAGLDGELTSYRLWSKPLGILDDNGWVHIVRKSGVALSRESTHEGQIAGDGHMALQLSDMRGRLSLVESQLQQTLARLQQRDAEIVAMQSELSDARAQLLTTQAQLAHQTEVLEWMQTSRSWRLLTSLRNSIQTVASLGVAHRLGQRKGSHFRGELETPVKDARCAVELKVVGWLVSTDAPITRLEVFLDGMYLGQLHYGLERQDLAGEFPPHFPLECGYAGRFALSAAHAGRRTLLVRGFDTRGRRQLITRTLLIENERG